MPELIQAAPYIYRLKMPPFGPPSWEVSNVYFAGNKEIFLIDAGYPTPQSIECILDAWKELGSPKIKAVLVTHAHLDHMGGLSAIEDKTGAPVWTHKLEAEFFGEMFPQERVDKTLEEGEKLQADEVKLHVLHLPGHTEGHLAFLEESARTLFTGDLVLGHGYAIIVPPRGDMVKYMDSLRRMEKLGVGKILPGHGPVVEDGAGKIEEYITHRILREIQILRQLEGGEKSIPDMAEEIYSDMAPVLRQAGRLQVLAHLIKMEDEGSVKHVSGDGPEAVYRNLVGKLPF